VKQSGEKNRGFPEIIFRASKEKTMVKWNADWKTASA
jgi:hypothetical protein